MADKAQVQALPQMGIKQCHCDPRDVIKLDVANLFLVRIFGEAVSIKEKEARSGDHYSYLIGDFGAQNAAGELFTSEKLFLPTSIQEKIEVQLSQANGKVVKFGYDIFAVADPKVTAGYRYAGKTVLATEATDRLDAMRTDLDKIALPSSPASPEKPATKKK